MLSGKSRDHLLAVLADPSGQIVGDASPPKSSVHTFLYSGGKMKDLGVFYDSSVAEAINTFGVVVGTADVLNSNGTGERSSPGRRGARPFRVILNSAGDEHRKAQSPTSPVSSAAVRRVPSGS